jgi:AcrR family transcriptional regulator
MRVFWRHGYDGASLTALTAAMGINRPSLYAAFGDKAALFREAVALYGTGPGRYVRRALGQPTARKVAETLLRGAVSAATDPANPGGCLWVQGALVAGAESDSIRRMMVDLREGGITQIRERLLRAGREGDLPSTSDPEALTHYLISVMNGISVQGASGRSRDDLNKVADLALTAWPS